MLPKRNELCWCGSGKKYKHCHLSIDPRKAPAAARAKQAPSEALRSLQYKDDPPPSWIKTPAQIAGIRRACRLAYEILERVGERIHPGITTVEIDDWVHAMTEAHGARSAPLHYKGYPKSCCVSVNEVVCHGIPGAQKLEEGDILNVDVTPLLDGFYGDSSRMYGVGQIHEAAQGLCTVGRECLAQGIAQVRPGGHIGDIGHAIQEHAQRFGYSVVRDFVGHGTGVRFHEDPLIPHVGLRGAGARFAPGMVFTIEPMINAGDYRVRVQEDGWTAVTRDGSLSAQWEHTVLVTETGCEVLTAG